MREVEERAEVVPRPGVEMGIQEIHSGRGIGFGASGGCCVRVGRVAESGRR
jgi:hypothetical protein